MGQSTEINELIEDFSFFESWEDKYQYLIDMGRNVPPMADDLKIEENKLRGCQSVVYFSHVFHYSVKLVYFIVIVEPLRRLGNIF